MSLLKKLKDASSLDDLVAILGYKPSGLAYIVYKMPAEQKYKKFTIPKSGCGEREIFAPCEPLKTLQRRLPTSFMLAEMKWILRAAGGRCHMDFGKTFRLSQTHAAIKGAGTS